MKKYRSFKLLSKTTLIYLVFSFLAFFSSAVFLIHEADKFVTKELEHRFLHSEKRIRHYLHSGEDISKNNSIIPISPLKAIPAPIYTDTMVYNSDLEQMQRFRKKVTFLEENNQFYRIELIKGMDDFYRLKENIFATLVPAFILLAVIIVLFNYMLSGYFFRPFNKILGQMKTYDVGKGTKIEEVHTTTTEFNKMQKLFHNMVQRIDHDYRNLKEYTENMAHEIQTPLTVIRNKTENLIADEQVMHRHAGNVKIIYDETNHLSSLGNVLNLMTKIENGEFNNAVPITTRPVIENHVAAISELSRLKSFTINTELAEDHQLLIDPFLFDIVLKNLLRNALHYGTSDGPISIATVAGRLSVSNYGPPLAVPFEKLFERFYRQNNTPTSLGLGLSLVKKICDLNDIRIDYQYRDGQHIINLVSGM